jgi:hypothetical protein
MSTERRVEEFDLELEEMDVKLKLNGQVRECVLRELDGFERDQYLNSQRGKIERGTQNLRDFSDVQSSLISACLFEKNGERIPVKEVREFPSKVQMRIYKLCMELNGFDIVAEQESKNV